MMRLSEADLHPHFCLRMQQRGVSLQEVEATLNEGWDAPDAKPGTCGKVLVFPYNALWKGRFYEEKEVTVYYKPLPDGRIILLTVKARYGKGFPKGRC